MGRHDLVLTDHVLTVPLDHAMATGPTIDVYAREVADPEGAHRPLLLYLQGGPGHEAPRPTATPAAPSWLERALLDHRVLMLDQRGTGRSTPYGPPGDDAAADADYLRHFRADSIVQDAECFREHLGAPRWSLLGQSFGGFCALHYLSTRPDSVREAYFTGGLPPVGVDVDAVYRRTYNRIRALNQHHHRRFPQDRERLDLALAACAAGRVRRPNGDPVSPRLFRTIGNQLGLDGGSDQIHFLLERDPGAAAFGADLDALLPFRGRNPLYAVLHESSYADGVATRWSAGRCLPADFDGDSRLLTGEHLYAWHFKECSDLLPYREVAAVLARHTWPQLYDADVLRQVDLPAAAVIYADDPFVDRGFSEQTADLLPRLRRWVSQEHLHNGLRVDGGTVLDRLITLARSAASDPA